MHQLRMVHKSVWFIHYLMGNMDQQQLMLLAPLLEYTHPVWNVNDPIRILVRQLPHMLNKSYFKQE